MKQPDTNEMETRPADEADAASTDIEPVEREDKPWLKDVPAPTNRLGLSKVSWYLLIVCEAILITICFFTASLWYGIPAVIIALVIGHYGEDFILYDSNVQIAEYQYQFKDRPGEMTEEHRNEIYAAMREERQKARREKKASKAAARGRVSYEDALEEEIEKSARAKGMTVAEFKHYEEVREPERAKILGEVDVLRAQEAERAAAEEKQDSEEDGASANDAKDAK
jgi:hypothetical protein